MKSLHLYGLALLSFAACLPLRAQSFSVTASGYTSAKLFDSTSGYTITGMATDGLGNVYYIETDMNFAGNTKLYKRSSLDNYASAALLYNFGDIVNGGFVVFASGKLYFGENTNGNIYSINTDGTGADPLGSLPVNYHAAYSGGRLFVSYDAGSLNSRVSRFDLVSDGTGGLMLASEDVIVTADNDLYGTFEYAGGELYYGASAAGSAKGIYLFTAAEVSGAIGAGSLTIDAAHEFGAISPRPGIAGLALGSSTDLWATSTSSTALRVFDRFNGGVSTIGSAGSGSNLGQLDFTAGTLFMNVSDFSVARSSIYTVAVPEPSAAFTLLAASLLTVRRRR